MLSFTDIQNRNGVLVFPDDAKAGLFWALPLNLMAEKDDEFTGQYTMFGRGDADRAANILGAFWSLTLTPAPLAPHMNVLKSALSTEAQVAEIRSAGVKQAKVTVTLSDDPLIAQSKSQNVWGGNDWAFNGQVDPGDAAGLRDDWNDGLRDARAEIVLTLVGAEPAETLSAQSRKMSLGFGEGHLTFATQTQSAQASQIVAGQRVLKFSIPISPGRRAAKKKLILSGFDR